MKYIIDTDKYPFDIMAIQVIGIGDDDTNGEPTVFSRTYGAETFDKLENKTYEDGLKEAWEAAKTLRKLSTSDLKDIFNTQIYMEVINSFTPQEVIKRIKNY